MKPLALTIGEPAGIGPDIAIAAWLRRHKDMLPPFYLIGDVEFIRNRTGVLGVDVPLAQVAAEEAVTAFSNALPVVATGHRITARAGHPDDSSAPAAIAS